MKDGQILSVFRAVPEKFEALGGRNLRLVACTSPAIVDGKMYVRSGKQVVCYDIRRLQDQATRW